MRFQRKPKSTTVVNVFGQPTQGATKYAIVVDRDAWEKAVDELTIFLRDRRTNHKGRYTDTSWGVPSLSDRTLAREIVEQVQRSLGP